MTRSASISRPALCSPGLGLSCFACCPPIRPAGYDHADHQGSLRRLLAENRAAFMQGHLPQRPMVGFWCPGLGFLDPQGRQVGCLLHPAQNQGQDLRHHTGYQEKCRRESCAQARAFAQLEDQQAAALLALAQGLDAFAFSSRRNPLMRLLDFGPEVAGAVAGLGLASLDQLGAWPWLNLAPAAQGWLLGRLIELQGAQILAQPQVHLRLAELAGELSRRLAPPPAREQGQPLAELCPDQWQARFWAQTLGRRRARPSELERWRQALEDLLGS